MPVRLSEAQLAALSPAPARPKGRGKAAKGKAARPHPVAGSVTYCLPLPPTANHLYPTVMVRGRPRRVKSGEYRRWIALATERAV